MFVDSPAAAASAATVAAASAATMAASSSATGFVATNFSERLDHAREANGVQPDEEQRPSVLRSIVLRGSLERSFNSIASSLSNISFSNLLLGLPVCLPDLALPATLGEDVDKIKEAE
ncbi:hypothetical protein T265_09010 [Opisthorchis viverrini]|uniref:Uncharacterized protein n=1 Tax=Opisthorchis viverrini TaxID=6198 RepID=A0A074ZI90_OPIVI|nr:hypothetical protein T265_09010 [Opisthorchis viverrini]KER23030.1 hypothetical protein T265_09010 [Opisthorchis viverrini]